MEAMVNSSPVFLLSSDAFWNKKRVFITGHTGFKGGWLSLWLQYVGAEVHGYALDPNSDPNFFTSARVSDGMQSTIGDVRDYPSLTAALQKCKPEIIFHLAAQPLVRESYNDPVKTYSTNVMGTVHLLEAVRQTPGVRAIVNVTSDKCYENQEWAWGYREIDALGGHDPYSNSKGVSELVSSCYRNSFFKTSEITLATARAGNVIGGGDWSADRLVPDILRALQTSQAAVIRNPLATRPWQHVLEPLSGYLRLAERLYTEGNSFAEAWNFGPLDDEAKSVGWIATELTQLFGSTATWVADASNQPHEAHFLKLDISKARARLGWTPRLLLADALRLTVDWARQHEAGQDMHVASLSQIRNYLT